MTLHDMPPGEAIASERGSSNDHVRRHNLSVILGLVHRADGLSRSQLTRQTGLNRSTVAALVAELADRGLVIEVEPDASNQVGRPSPVVKPSARVVGVSVHPEIDAITIGAMRLGGTVIERVRLPLDHAPTVAEAVEISTREIAAMLGRLGPDYRVAGIGVAVPGQVRTQDGLVRLAPHLRWQEEPLGELLEAATGYPVVVANDAHLGIMAENTFGAGRGFTELVYLNGGASGVGGGIVINGTPLGGTAGYAGELGHTLVNSAGTVCHCGAIGCLETEVQRSRLLELAGLDDADDDEFEAALLGSRDPLVAAEVHRQLDFLAVALRNAVNTLNPRLIVLGGFLGALYAAAPEYLDALVASQPLRASSEVVELRRAELGSKLLSIGAGELAFEALLADPAGYALAAVVA
jgi:predicted NBD/HSP70 family sugar kinase